MKKMRIASFVLTLFATIFALTNYTTFLTPAGFSSYKFTEEAQTLQIIQYLGMATSVVATIFALISLVVKGTNKALFVINIIITLAALGISIYFFYDVFFGTVKMWEGLEVLYPAIVDRIMFIILPVLTLTLGFVAFMLTVFTNSDKNQVKQAKEGKKVKAPKADDTTQSAIPGFETTTDNPQRAQQKATTVDIADRVQKMRQDLIEGNFENYQDTEDNTLIPQTATQTQSEPMVAPVQNIMPEPIGRVQPQPVVKPQVQPEPEAAPVPKNIPYEPKVFKSITEEFGEIKPKNPYQEVILPRRMSGMKYDGEPVKKYSDQKIPERDKSRVQLDGSYRDKLFVGEGERIWEVLKSVERPQPVNKPNTQNTYKPADVETTTTYKKSNTMEVNVDDINDPINDNSSSPTIDWEE